MAEAMNGIPEDDAEALARFRDAKAVNAFLDRLDLEIKSQFKES